jgi:hypothetical protein
MAHRCMVFCQRSSQEYEHNHSSCMSRGCGDSCHRISQEYEHNHSGRMSRRCRDSRHRSSQEHERNHLSCMSRWCRDCRTNYCRSRNNCIRPDCSNRLDKPLVSYNSRSGRCTLDNIRGSSGRCWGSRSRYYGSHQVVAYLLPMQLLMLPAFPVSGRTTLV